MYATASAKPALLRNPLFDYWSAGQPTEWTHQSTTNATYTRLRKTDPLTAVTRTVFGSGLKRSDGDYIYGADDGFRITMAGAVSANDWIIRQDAASGAGLTVRPTQHMACRVAARCSVENNLLNIKIIGLVDTTDTFYLVPVGGTYFKGRTSWEWSTTDTAIPLTMKTRFQVWGIEIPSFPLNCSSVSVEAANGSTGAQVIDLGELALEENLDELGGAE